NPDYWDKGKPYLDGYRAVFMTSSSAMVAAVRGERAHAQFRGFSPSERDSIVQALGNKITVQESPWNCVILVALNHEKKPFGDKPVPRPPPLAPAVTRGPRALSKSPILRAGAGPRVRGTPGATPPAELETLAGYSKDIAASRAEAKRLLKEAGAENLSF